MIKLPDNVFDCTATAIRREFAERCIDLIKWSSFSPDLNFIGNIWNWMKDYRRQVRGYFEAFRTIICEVGPKGMERRPGCLRARSINSFYVCQNGDSDSGQRPSFQIPRSKFV